MKELLLIKDTPANRISYYHLALFLLSLPFDRFYSHLLVISFALHTFIHFNRSVVKPIFTLRTLTLQSVFFVTVISTIYAVNKQAALGEWGLYITIFLIPILFCVNPLDLKKYRTQLLTIFALGCTATIIYLYTDAFITIVYYKLPLSAIVSPAFTNHNFSLPIDMHATFFSLQIAIAFIHILSMLVKEQIRLNRVIYIICGVILAAGIIQLSSKSVVFALFLTILAFPFFSLEGIRRRRFIIIFSCLSVLLIGGLLNSHTFHERYVTELNNDVSASTATQTVEPRLARWGVAVDLIKQSPVIGHGAGSETNLLRESYFAKKYYRSYLNRLNVHNEYLSFLIKSGIWGLAVYLLTLVYGFKLAMRKKDIVFFSFMLLLAIVSLSENILDADKGVMFYSFFLPFFVFVSDREKVVPIHVKKDKKLQPLATKPIAVPS